MVSIQYTLFGLLSATLAVAHMELAWPTPLRSKHNPNTPWGQIDYSMTSPLVASGTYPCKGYITSPDDVTMTPVTSWSAGGTYNYTVAGTATHGGGSCQLVMSYDYGKTWQVIFSYIGGCMVEGSTTEFTLPADAPNGEAMFGWNWFNRVGNREMYQNCAVVTITNGGGGLSPSVYPVPFVANAGVNDCSTVEGQDPVFPEPGPNVRYGGAYAGGNAQSGLGITGSNCYGPGEQGGGTPAGSGSGSGAGAGAGSASVSAIASASSASSWSEPSASSAYAAPSASSAAWGEPSASASSGESAAAESASSSQGGRGDGQGGGWWQGGRPTGSSSAWVAEPTVSQSRIGHEHAADPTASSAAGSAPSPSAGKVCRRRKRAIPLVPGHGSLAVEARHERLIPRRMYEEEERRSATGRVAALKAEHIVRS